MNPGIPTLMEIERLLAESPDSFELNFQKAQCLEQLGQYTEAESAVRVALKYGPAHKESRELFHSLQQRKKQNNPSNSPDSNPISKADLQKMRLLLTKTFLNEVAGQMGNFAWVCNEANDAMMMGRYELALELLDFYLQVPGEKRLVQHARAICFLALGRLADAEKAVRAELERYLANPDAQRLLQEIHKQQLGKTLSPTARSSDSRPLLALAQFCLEKELRQSARLLLAALACWHPQNMEVRLSLAKCTRELEVKRHKQSFEAQYSQLEAATPHMEFPLDEMEKCTWNRGVWADNFYNYIYRRTSTHILHRLGLMNGQRVLIVGCGLGNDEKNIHHLHPSIELQSVDISEEMVHRAISRQTPSHFALSLAEKLPFPNDAFDRILAREVIEHVLDPQKMIAEIHRVLKPGGIALVSTPNAQSWSPDHYYDERIAPILAKWFHYQRPLHSYKDDPPFPQQIINYARSAGLSFQEYFFDCSLYFYLGSLPRRWPRLERFFKRKMAGIAHYFSCLENHQFLATVFCDQAKYVLAKHASAAVATNSTQSTMGYACPECHSALRPEPTGYSCISCHSAFPLTRGIPNFIIALPDALAPLSPTASPPGKRTMRAFRSVNLTLRCIYCGLYLVLAILASLVSRKNHTRMSRLIPAQHPYQTYIRIHDRRSGVTESCNT